MLDLGSHPINQKWPAKDPSVLQLYSFPTPNGVKVSIALEEMCIPYEAHTVTLADTDVKSPEFLALNPNNKIPATDDKIPAWIDQGNGDVSPGLVRKRCNPDLSC